MSQVDERHEKTVGMVIIVVIVGAVLAAAAVVALAAVGIIVYLTAPVPEAPVEVWEATTPLEETGAAAVADPGASPLLDATARQHVAAAGIAWETYEGIVQAVEGDNPAQARLSLAELPVLHEDDAVQEELELLRIASEVGEMPPGTLANRMLDWRLAHPASRLGRYSQLIDCWNCVSDARQQGSAAGAAEDAGDATLAFCTVTLVDLSYRTATDPYVAGEALRELGYAYKSLDQPHEALQAWGRLVNELPDHPRAMEVIYSAGGLAWGEERYDEATAWYGTYLERYPDEPKARTVENNKRAVELIGQPAPELVVDHWLGAPTTLADHRGEVVLMVFWNEWCRHCHAQIPRAQEFQDRYGAQGLTVLLVTKHNKDQTDEKVTAFLAANGATLPCAVEPEGFQTTSDYAVHGVPTAAVVGRDGTVVWRNHPIRLEDEKIEALLAQ